MDRIDLYRIFIRVTEARSFTRAADGLQLPRSTVSAAIAELEARIGARLLHRTTRSVTPTREGEEFHERCLSFLAEHEEIESLFRGGKRQVAGRLRVEVPARIGRLVLAPALPAFLAQWPELRIEIGSTDRMVDMISEGVDCALRIGPLAESRLRQRSIGAMAQINVASPDYLARHGVPTGLSDLARHYQVGYASPSTGRIADWEWRDGGRSQQIAMAWRVSANSAEGYIASALAGLGMIQIPAYDVAAHIASGALVEVLAHARPAPLSLHLLFAAQGRIPARVAIFADWLEALVLDAIAAGEGATPLGSHPGSGAILRGVRRPPSPPPSRHRSRSAPHGAGR